MTVKEKGSNRRGYPAPQGYVIRDDTRYLLSDILIPIIIAVVDDNRSAGRKGGEDTDIRGLYSKENT
eukprot:1393250-Amorphochlora_amoeboformis.AAC.1